jgi:hypothetical protein
MISTDTLQTWLGLLKAIMVAVGGALYAAFQSPDGFNWNSPVLWLSLFYAAVEGVKGYFAAGVKPEAVKP